MLSQLLVVIALGGVIAYIPSAYLALKENVWVVAFADTLAVVFFLILAFAKGFSYRLKVFSVIFASYTLGLTLLIYTGPFGAGYLYIFAFVFSTALFGDIKAMALANTLAILTHIGIAVGAALRMFSWPQGFDSVVVISANFIFISLVLSYSANFLLRGYAKAADEEKRVRETLESTLREVEHRTKNNIQFLSSLVGYISKAEKDPEKALHDIHESLSAIAVVQKLLDREKSSSLVGIKLLFSSLIERYKSLYRGLEFDFEWLGSEVEIDGNISVVLGVLMNEIITNAAKHAYPSGERGRLFVKAGYDVSERKMRFSIGDEGRGIDEGASASNGIGRTIIDSLAAQLGAEMRTEGPPGLVYRFEMPFENAHVRGTK